MHPYNCGHVYAHLTINIERIFPPPQEAHKRSFSVNLHSQQKPTIAIFSLQISCTCSRASYKMCPCVLLPSFSIMVLRFIHIAACVSIECLFILEQYWRAILNWSVHALIGGTSVLPSSGATMNKAAMKFSLHVLFHFSWVSTQEHNFWVIRQVMFNFI